MPVSSQDPPLAPRYTSNSRGASRASSGPSRTSGTGHHPELARRDIDPGQRRLVAHLGKGRQEVVPTRFQQAFLGQRARGDQTAPRRAARPIWNHASSPPPGLQAVRRSPRGTPCGSASADSPRQHGPARRTSRCPAPDACRAWSARCPARRMPRPHPRRTSRRSRPSGRTAARPDSAALISRYCAIIGVTLSSLTRGPPHWGRSLAKPSGRGKRQFRLGCDPRGGLSRNPRKGGIA